MEARSGPLASALENVMPNLVIASTEADSAAAEAIERHHAELSAALVTRVEALVNAASHQDSAAATTARAELVAWAERELLPHAAAEEESLYRPAQEMSEARLLVSGMLDEHRTLAGLLAEVASTSDAVRAATAARALQVLFQTHLTKENELVLPLLASDSQVSLAGLLEGMHGALVGHGAVPRGPKAEGRHSCGCGDADDAGFPELDARIVPHAIRHATVFGALDAVAPHSGMILIAPHDPLPLLAQIEQRDAGAFAVEYLERGPEAWRLQFVRQSA